MRKRRFVVFGTALVAVLAAVFAVAAISPGSSHREAPLSALDPTGDDTDVYAFKAQDAPDSLTLVANWIPFEDPAGGPNFYRFDDRATYYLNVDNTGDGVYDIRFRFRFRTSIGDRGSFLYAAPTVDSIDSPNLNVKQTYTVGVRRLAARYIVGLARTSVTPNALTTAGVLLCVGSAIPVYFEYRNEILFYWLGAVVFVVGSILDILDGALARAGGKATPFGSFLDSTTDRVGEGAMLIAIALIFSRQGNQIALGATVAAVAGSFLVSYTRAKAEALGLRGNVGLGSRAERVVVITAGLVLAPWGALQWAIYLLTATAWITVLQRILFVRKQLAARE